MTAPMTRMIEIVAKKGTNFGILPDVPGTRQVAERCYTYSDNLLVCP